MISIIILLIVYMEREKPATEVLREYNPKHVDERWEFLTDDFLASSKRKARGG
ncbi:MAG: hypothetical protein OXC79_00035 [Candidatus Poribacteria bacterium]|nr:hypothetical protein [Candidatus Poribacteria bacterium]